MLGREKHKQTQKQLENNQNVFNQKRRETQTNTDTIKKQSNSSSIRTRINNQLETQ